MRARDKSTMIMERGGREETSEGDRQGEREGRQVKLWQRLTVQEETEGEARTKREAP